MSKYSHGSFGLKGNFCSFLMFFQLVSQVAKYCPNENPAEGQRNPKSANLSGEKKKKDRLMCFSACLLDVVETFCIREATQDMS